jgi:N-methylhydantoinase B
VNGGAPGQRARKILEKADGTQTVVANKLDSLDVEAGDQLHFITWGGGGWGNPLERDPALVGLEIRQGLVSVAGARVYGVVADADGHVDAAATERLRAEMAAAQPAEPAIFNYGGTVEELRARCEAETGLPAPKPPVWHFAEAAE